VEFSKESVYSPIRRYDAEILSHRSIVGNGFRVELETQNVTGHRDFEVYFPEHILTLTPDGPPTWVESRIDGNPVERFDVRPGQLTLVPARQRFRGYTDGLGTRGEMRLLFTPDFVTLMSGTESNEAGLGLVHSMALRNPTILQVMSAIAREVEQPGLMGRLYVDSLVTLALTEVVRHHSTLAVPSKRTEDLPSRRLRRVIDYIEANLGEDLSLLSLASEADLSLGHFGRAFSQAMGRPVHRYVLGRRIEAAAALLRDTERPIVEIALTTGFYSQSHLTTAFRRLFGTTPSAYRRQRRR
jgi:AraC family transcriptional regulator